MEISGDTIGRIGKGKWRSYCCHCSDLAARPSAICFTLERRFPLKIREYRHLFDIRALALGCVVCVCNFISSSVQHFKLGIVFHIFFLDTEISSKRVSEFSKITLAFKMQYGKIPVWSGQRQSPT